MAVKITLKNGKTVYEARVYTRGTSTPKKIGRFTNKRLAERFEENVKKVLHEASVGTVSADTQRWLDSLDDDIYSKIKTLSGVLPARVKAGTLDSLLETYLADNDLAPNTKVLYRLVITALKRGLPEKSKSLAISELSVDQIKTAFKALSDRYSLTTVRSMRSTISTMFNYAVKLKWIPESPMTDIHVKTPDYTKNHRFITLETVSNALDLMPTAEYKLLIVLSRFGGLRLPSEAVMLSWDLIDFNNGIFTLYEPKKTKGSALREAGDYATRTLPLFPEVRAALLDFAVESKQDTRGAIQWSRPVYLMCNSIKKILRRNNLDWPRTFHNMRASRETELIDTFKFPPQTVCQWIGNSEPVYRAHYARIRKEDLSSGAELTSMKVLPKVLDTHCQNLTIDTPIDAKMRLLLELRDNLRSFVNKWQELTK